MRERAGVDAQGARQATDAVLGTPAERIAGGQVDDLVARLDPGLHAPRERGREHGGGRAQPMAFERFIELVAEREGVSPSVARAHARAVFQTLREAVDDDEFFGTTAQLPQDYVSALAPARA